MGGGKRGRNEGSFVTRLANNSKEVTLEIRSKNGGGMGGGNRG